MNGYRLALMFITAIGLAGCLTFVATYAIRSRGAWWSSEAGRYMMAFQLNLGALFILVLANQITQTQWPGRQAVTIGLYIVFVAETWWPLRLLFKSTEGRSSENEQVRGIMGTGSGRDRDDRHDGVHQR